MWTWDTTALTFDQTCWYFDGHDGCTPGGDDAPTLIVYEKPSYARYERLDLPVKTVKKVFKKVEKYKQEKKFDKQAIEAIVESMVDVWSKREMRAAMEQLVLDEQRTLEAYRESLRELLEEELALILILASI